jgi:hypothetical protein
MRWLTFVSIAGLVLFAAPVGAEGEDGGVLIDFEKFPDGTTIPDGTRITTQFSDWGVSSFSTTDENGPQITRFNLEGTSGVNQLGGAGSNGGHQYQQPITATFDGVTSHVSVTGLDVGVHGLVMEAYMRGVLVDSDRVEGTGRGLGVDYVDTLSVSAFAIDTVVIRQIRHIGSGDGYVIDDLEFDCVWDPNGGFGPNNRPVYLILSLDETFDTSDCVCECEVCECGSDTIIINIGTFLAGDEIPDTRFELRELAEGILSDLDLELLDGHQITILGAFDTISPNSIHLASPDEGDVPVKVQEAFFLASPFLTPEIEQQLTTVEIAQFIFETATGLNPMLAMDMDGEGPDEPLTTDQILQNIFVTDATVECPPGDVACEADGDLFPHPDGDFSPLFNFDFQIAPDGDLTVAIVVDIKVDIKPGSDENPINLGAKGVLPVAILATLGLIEDIDDVDATAINVGGVPPVKYTIEDVNDDGLDDLIFHFKIQELVSADALTTATEELTIEAKLTVDGADVRGSDVVRIVPPKKGKKK